MSRSNTLLEHETMSDTVQVQNGPQPPRYWGRVLKRILLWIVAAKDSVVTLEASRIKIDPEKLFDVQLTHR